MTDHSPALLPFSSHDPIEIFKLWLKEAEASEPNDPSAVCVATIDETGMPDARMVLIRRVNAQGFTFFTNYESRKGQEILNSPKAALCFHWKTLEKQVRVQGLVEKTSEAEADEYYNSRHRNSRIGAWASLQSAPLADRDILLKRYQEFEEKFASVENPPRPPHWSGFRIVPEKIEFWQQGEFRLHERHVFTRDAAAASGWTTTLLYP